jgi:hypothetical protein
MVFRDSGDRLIGRAASSALREYCRNWRNVRQCRSYEEFVMNTDERFVDAE